MKHNLIAALAITLIGTLISGTVVAQTPNQSDLSIRSSFRNMKQIMVPESVSVPTVIEMPVTNAEIQQWPYVLFDTSTQRFVRIIQRSTRQTTPARITQGITLLPNLTDALMGTYVDFAAESDSTTTVLSYDAGTFINSSQLKIDLDQYSKVPSAVALYTDEGTKALVSTDTKLTDGSIYFPLTGAQHWEIRLVHSQPLRITGISLVPAYSTQGQSYAVRFLAVPGHMYYMYMNPNTGAPQPYVEYADLESNTGVAVIPESPTVSNPEYVKGDRDFDSISDDSDNCPDLANPDQTDTNNNRKGDACEDFDRDSVMNINDNCQNASNITQQDADGDGYGDVCDPEESRITERYWWLPWLGIVVGFGVVVSIFATTVKRDRSS